MNQRARLFTHFKPVISGACLSLSRFLPLTCEGCDDDVLDC